jgi:hypothetical protein
MTPPLPPVVHGPITPSSPSVQVSAVLEGATVDLVAGGNPIGTNVGGPNGTVWVPISQQPGAGQVVTATQKTADGTSAAAIGITVVDPPNPLPAPVFVSPSPMSNAMSAVLLGGLVPGARVVLRNGGSTIGQAIATNTGQWIDITLGANIAPNSALSARQDLNGIMSPEVGSLPVDTIGEGPLSAPTIGTPITACESSINVTTAVPAADLVIDNEGTPTTWHNVAATYAAWGAPPFKQGKIVAHQSFPRFNRTSPDTEVPVGAPQPPAQPAIQGDVCPQVGMIRISNLAPAGVLTISTVTPDPHNPGAVVITPIGTAGISAETETFYLPPNLQPTTPAGAPVQLVAQQTRCGLTSPESARVGFAQPGGFAGAPIIAPYVYPCTRVIVLQSAHTGAQVVVHSVKTGAPLGDPTLVGASPTVLYRTWFPVSDQETGGVEVVQSGCNADGKAQAPLTPLPDLPVPQVAEPIRPAAPAIYVKGPLLRGAMAHLLVNGKLRASQEATYADAWIAVPPPALVENDTLIVVQTLCAKSTTRDQHGVTVARGHLKVTVSNPTVERTKTVSETVTATDADTGIPVVGAQVLLDGKPVGTTGTPFVFAPAAGQPSPNGIVKSPTQYFDEPFTITLKDPPPATATLTLNLARTVLIYQQLAMASAAWTVTPLWNPAQKVTANGPNATVTLPKPPGGSGHVQIQLAATWQAASDNIGGYAFYGSFSGNLMPNPTEVVWDGLNRNVGWIADYWVGLDPNGNPKLVVTENYVGIQ